MPPLKNPNWPFHPLTQTPNSAFDHNPVKLHFPKKAKFELLPLNNPGDFHKYSANTENCFLPKAQFPQEIESQVETTVRFSPHDTASKPATHPGISFCTGWSPFKERNKAKKIMEIQDPPNIKLN
ncbi:hypothetical protein TNIN_297941 [Trichonephila inaurata madagascariensis]|uniref:Uncharacterized protein n=1 Tax=Trichonephila inaurata madagascariensis TaxID=2747483 RepID=A0A8X6XRF5_9ARAC|nr:hypothetical protein TNIN_297941 [Trichonephila inaurata madagascariensis]